ncbi:uncharacterized protein LOC111398197 [Olea europaea var. sylvestris]|nr:uncharacterized protein LOC111398197 [Olea europaea var. sylvestris]
MKYFSTCDQNISGPSCCESNDICDNSKFVDNELKLYEACTIIPDNDFEDYQAQATYSATYIIWLEKAVQRMPVSFGVELQNIAEDGKLRDYWRNYAQERAFFGTLRVDISEADSHV